MEVTLAVRFSYNVNNQQITANQGLSTAPSMAPRAISASRDGSYWMTGWALLGCGFGALGDCTAGGPLLAQWPNASGDLSVGSVAIRSSRSLIYAQIAPSAVADKNPLPPNLLVLDADNLTVRERIQIPENLAGRSVFNADDSVLYSISDSGLTVFRWRSSKKPRVCAASVEDVVFSGNFCNAVRSASRSMSPTRPGMRRRSRSASPDPRSCSAAGISISPSSGVTPARVKITIDPIGFAIVIGTAAFKFEIRSAQASICPPPPARGQIEKDYTAQCSQPVSRPGQ